MIRALLIHSWLLITFRHDGTGMPAGAGRIVLFIAYMLSPFYLFPFDSKTALIKLLQAIAFFLFFGKRFSSMFLFHNVVVDTILFLLFMVGLDMLGYSSILKLVFFTAYVFNASKKLQQN